MLNLAQVVMFNHFTQNPGGLSELSNCLTYPFQRGILFMLNLVSPLSEILQLWAVITRNYFERSLWAVWMIFSLLLCLIFLLLCLMFLSLIPLLLLIPFSAFLPLLSLPLNFCFSCFSSPSVLPLPPLPTWYSSSCHVVPSASSSFLSSLFSSSLLCLASISLFSFIIFFSAPPLLSLNHSLWLSLVCHSIHWPFL